MKTCDFEGCDKKHEAKGYCAGHYTQLLRGKKLETLHKNKRPNGSDPLSTLNERTVWSKENFFKGTPCLEWTGGLRDGYGSIWANGKVEGAHRWIYMRWYNIPALELDVLHHCDNHPCCNPWHLFLGTNQDNVDDRDNKGRQAKGEGHGSVILNNKLVLEIREKYATENYLQRELADKYGVSCRNISDIVNNKTWRHI